jgi:hypothetical protein
MTAEDLAAIHGRFKAEEWADGKTLAWEDLEVGEQTVSVTLINDGDCYDEVEGLFFDFSNSQLYQPTEAFKKLQKKYGKEVVTRSFYTIFC